MRAVFESVTVAARMIAPLSLLLMFATPASAEEKPAEAVTIGHAVPLSLEQREALAAKDRLRANPVAPAPPAKSVTPSIQVLEGPPLLEEERATRTAAKVARWTQVSPGLGPIPRPEWTTPGLHKLPDVTWIRPRTPAGAEVKR